MLSSILNNAKKIQQIFTKQRLEAKLRKILKIKIAYLLILFIKLFFFFYKYIVNAKDVETELIKYKEEKQKGDEAVSYFHGNVDRSTAEKLLKDCYQQNNGNGGSGSQARLDGLFLIRKCSASPDDFSLSMINNDACYHYRISHSIDAYYVLDDGPLIHGLDQLIKQYQLNSHGLPCKLNARFVPKMPLPSSTRLIGYTNPLHSAAACISEVQKVRLILRSSNRPEVDERDTNGRTALHIAAEYDNINVVEELIEANAVANIRARSGATPLHTAAEFGSIQCLQYLLKTGRVNPMERNMTNNWVPLHEAAYKDQYICVNALLNFGVPDRPRTADNETPLDLAIATNNSKTAHILRTYMPPEPSSRFRPAEYLHEASVSREIAKSILENFKNDNGAFLVRRTQRNENILVLSLICNNEFFNYEICLIDQPQFVLQQQQQSSMLQQNESNSGKHYFIDDGPYFRSLAHLIEHYSKYEDGLPGVLTKPISASLTLTLQQKQQQTSIVPFSSVSSTAVTRVTKPSSNINNPNSSTATNNGGPTSNQTLMNIGNQLAQQANQATTSTASGPFNSMIDNGGNGSASNNKTDSLIKANLFKHRTLLHDQRKRIVGSNQMSKKLPKIAMSEIQLQAIIGEGEFGTVYKGTYNGKQVAIKRLKDCSASSDFLREADIMGTLNNPCILKIFGLVQDKGYLMMVQELMISSILEKLWQSPKEVTEYHLKLWASQIALGMQHMEEQKIVHRDLAARNVLLASMTQVCYLLYYLSLCSH
jgi:serine/threonine protein kinase